MLLTTFGTKRAKGKGASSLQTIPQMAPVAPMCYSCGATSRQFTRENQWAFVRTWATQTFATSSDDLLHKLLLRRGFGLTDHMEELLRGGTIEHELGESLVLLNVELREDAWWSFLWFSGYLNFVRSWLDDRHRVHAAFAIPNVEVGVVYRNLFEG